MLLELALGAADREVTMARLATMGLADGQRVRLVALEVLPSIAASAVAAAVCVIALPQLVAPAIDLSVFTASQAPVPLRPDFASFLLPLAALLVVTVIALAYEIRSSRGRGRRDDASLRLSGVKRRARARAARPPAPAAARGALPPSRSISQSTSKERGGLRNRHGARRPPGPTQSTAAAQRRPGTALLGDD